MVVITWGGGNGGEKGDGDGGMPKFGQYFRIGILG